jgi:hypothetical protein
LIRILGLSSPHDFLNFIPEFKRRRRRITPGNPKFIGIVLKIWRSPYLTNLKSICPPETPVMLGQGH